MTRYTLVVLLMFIAITPAFGKEYQSSFGFTLDIPEHWLVLTSQELKENPDLFDLSEKKFPNIEKNLLKNIDSKVKSGQVEYYFNKNTSDSSFSDNINVMKQVGSIPQNDTQLREVCSSAPGQLSSYFGREIKVYQCKLVDINNLKSLLLEYDGIFEGTINIQYHIQKSPSVKILMTATCKNSVLDTIRKEFNRIVLSIKM
jgi:hypothetical protein